MRCTPVVAKSFNGDVRTLRPVPSKEDDRDWEEMLILPDLPIGPESRETQLPPAVPIAAGAHADSDPELRRPRPARRRRWRPGRLPAFHPIPMAR